MKSLAAVWLLLICQLSCAHQVNIYVTYHVSELRPAIEKFNHFLQKKGVFTKYDVTPFLGRYPLHTTLYLTDFPQKNLKSVSQRVRQLANQTAPFTIRTAHLSIGNGNYVMLDVSSPSLLNRQHNQLQNLSDAVVEQLHDLRNKQARIPDWAKHDARKRQSFAHYGSPNVFSEFSPHFTLMAKQFPSKQINEEFNQTLRALITDYQKRYPNQHLWIQATGIGIGYVNQYGQITQEIASFKFPIARTGKPVTVPRNRSFSLSVTGFGA